MNLTPQTVIPEVGERRYPKLVFLTLKTADGKSLAMREEGSATFLYALDGVPPSKVALFTRTTKHVVLRYRDWAWGAFEDFADAMAFALAPEPVLVECDACHGKGKVKR